MQPSISPLNQTAASPVTQSKKPQWEQLLDALDEKRPIECLEKQSGVVLSREYNRQRKYAVWTKIYQSAKGNDLSVFNEWEFDLLSRAQNLSVQGCYKSAELVKSGSPIHTGDTPILRRQCRQTVISTIHGGSDLADWKRMILRVNRQPVPHAFVEPANFLRLARGALEALHHLHSQDFIHCDLNPGNLVLPSLIEEQKSASKTLQLRPINLDKVKITPLWNKLIIIDLGYSLSRKIEPYTTLPLNTDVKINPRMSAHLRQRLDKIEQETKDHLSRIKSDKTWEDVRYDKKFWSNWKDSPLSLLQKLDWREDLHQLGFLLKDIRDSWGGGEHIKPGNPTLSQLIYTLPERLLAWGNADQLNRSAPDEMPHLKLISEIVDALAQAHDKDIQDTFFLYRADHDTDYAAQQKLDRERREHSLRRWRNPIAFWNKPPRFTKIAWATLRNNPSLSLLAITYSVFVLLAILMGKDPITLPLLGIPAIILGLAAWKWIGILIRGTARHILKLGHLAWHGTGQCFKILTYQLRRVTKGLRAVSNGFYFYPILLIPLAWGAESQYDLTSRAEKGYGVWQKARYYAESTQKIKESGWWKGERIANAQEHTWLDTTQQLAEIGMPQATFMAAYNRCYEMQDGGQVVIQNDNNFADCSPLISGALQEGAQRWHVLTNSTGWFAIAEDTVNFLDDARLSPIALRLAQTLMPGLEASAPYSDKLSYSLADIQSCWLKPAQNNNARQTLKALIDHFPDSALAKRAGKHLPSLEGFCSN